MEKVPVLLSRSGHFSLVKILIQILNTRPRADDIKKSVKEISHFEYLLESREFQIFARGEGEVVT